VCAKKRAYVLTHEQSLHYHWMGTVGLVALLSFTFRKLQVSKSKLTTEIRNFVFSNEKT